MEALVQHLSEIREQALQQQQQAQSAAVEEEARIRKAAASACTRECIVCMNRFSEDEGTICEFAPLSTFAGLFTATGSQEAGVGEGKHFICSVDLEAYVKYCNEAAARLALEEATLAASLASANSSTTTTTTIAAAAAATPTGSTAESRLVTSAAGRIYCPKCIANKRLLAAVSVGTHTHASSNGTGAVASAQQQPADFLKTLKPYPHHALATKIGNSEIFDGYIKTIEKAAVKKGTSQATIGK